MERKFGFHPRCSNIKLTHLCFAEDLMIFSDGQIRSMEGILDVFKEFSRMSGLQVSAEKLTAYIAGVSDIVRQDIRHRFLFEIGDLPVRYLGLPLLTKQMRSLDYAPLIDKIRSRINTWTARTIVEDHDSKKLALGSMDKYKFDERCRELAENFLKVEIHNGQKALFWYDNWSSMGPLLSKFGAQGCVDLGIAHTSTLKDVEEEIEGIKQSYREDESDVFLWKSSVDNYKCCFSSKATRDQLINHSPQVPWAAGIWFKHHHPKFAFITWLTCFIDLRQVIVCELGIFMRKPTVCSVMTSLKREIISTFDVLLLREYGAT
ncbi:uncharacterized protein LOC112085506 [Eutrema salsugineum]|uniref:uncharacterized protein LOC112085506 n=1 Tax=Eutrema salsugineum TaxID=72664 RepID=UPI000CED7601|nr:uncharacterized protein LOC112085506 [Eutrema salsugineum]